MSFYPILRQLVIDAVATATRQEFDVVAAAGSLFDLPGFDSLAIASVLEQLETALSLEVPPSEIVPEAFETVESLIAMLARARASHETGARSRT
jgi:acyl carrier protein